MKNQALQASSPVELAALELAISVRSRRAQVNVARLQGLDEIGDPHALGIRADIDDELMRDGNASDMV